jgi:hypothetical protein
MTADMTLKRTCDLLPSCAKNPRLWLTDALALAASAIRRVSVRPRGSRAEDFSVRFTHEIKDGIHGTIVKARSRPIQPPTVSRFAVNVHVVVRRILPDRLDQLPAHARDAAARAVGTREGTGEQRDHHRPGNRGGANMDVRRSHGAVDPSPAEVEADLT